MLEVEIKARIKDRAAIIKSLDKMGFTIGETVSETDEYYAGADRDFALTDEALRIRKSNDGEHRKYAITYKGPKLDKFSKTRIEYETGIADPDVMSSILGSLGYEKAYTVKKSRVYYYLNDVTACVDYIEELGDFLELETNKDTAEDLFLLINSLGMDKSDCIRESYLELLLRRAM